MTDPWSDKPETPRDQPETPKTEGAPGAHEPPQAYPPPPAYPPPAYPPPPPQPYAGYSGPVAAPRNGLGVTALVLGIIGLLACVFVVTGWAGVILGVIAVILGFIGRGRVKRGQANNGGVAVAGIVLGFLAILAGIAVTVVAAFVFWKIGGDDFVECINEAGTDQAKQQECADRFQRDLEDRFSITPTP